jgi:hypothetical protein
MIHFNTLLKSMPRCSEWSPPFRFYNQNCIQFSFPIHATCPAHLTLLDLIIPIILVLWPVTLCGLTGRYQSWRNILPPSLDMPTREPHISLQPITFSNCPIIFMMRFDDYRFILFWHLFTIVCVVLEKGGIMHKIVCYDGYRSCFETRRFWAIWLIPIPTWDTRWSCPITY